MRLVLTKLRKVLPEQVAVTRQTVALAGGCPPLPRRLRRAQVLAGVPNR